MNIENLAHRHFLDAENQTVDVITSRADFRVTLNDLGVFYGHPCAVFPSGKVFARVPELVDNLNWM